MRIEIPRLQLWHLIGFVAAQRGISSGSCNSGGRRGTQSTAGSDSFALGMRLSR